MRKIILMAVAGYLWKKFKANRATDPATDMGSSSVATPRASMRK